MKAIRLALLLALLFLVPGSACCFDITLQWDTYPNPDDIQNFRLYQAEVMRDKACGDWAVIAQPGKTLTQYDVEGLNDAKAYSFMLTAYGTNDVESLWSNITWAYGPSAECRADFDFDGDVDGSDLSVFSVDYGRTDCPGCP